MARNEAKLRKIDAVAADVRGDPATREAARKAAARLRSKPPVLLPITIQVAKPRPPSFHGRVETAMYALTGADHTVAPCAGCKAEEHGTIQLFSEEGRSLGRKFSRKIIPPLNGRETAAILLRSKVDWKSSSFSRPLVYPKGF